MAASVPEAGSVGGSLVVLTPDPPPHPAPQRSIPDKINPPVILFRFISHLPSVQNRRLSFLSPAAERAYAPESEIHVVERFAPGNSSHGHPHPEINAFGDESHGSIGHEHVDAAGVPRTRTTKGPKLASCLTCT